MIRVARDYEEDLQLVITWPQLVSLITKYLHLVSTCVTDYRWEVVARCQDDKQDIRGGNNRELQKERGSDSGHHLANGKRPGYTAAMVIGAPTC